MQKILKDFLIKENYQVHYGYYIMVALGYTMAMFSSQVRPGIIATALLLVIWLQYICRSFLAREYVLAGEGGKNGMAGKTALRFCERPCMGTIDILAMAYFFYNLLSGIWCRIFGMPVSVWLGEFTTGILTMVFFITGRYLRSKGRDVFYRGFIIAVCFLGTLGLILFITGPRFYLDYLYNIDLISKADLATMRVRMHSVIGSIQMGYISVAGMLACVHMIMGSRGKKGKALLFICMLFAFLSNQRSAMVVAIMVLLYINYLLFFTFRLMDKKWLVIECAALGVLALVLMVLFIPAVMKVYYRLVSLPGAIGQRSDQWIGAINNMNNLWLGNGLGANGHRANGIAEHMIADGGLAKLFVEMGIIGTSIFTYMMILCFKYGIRNLRECSAEVGILAMTLLTSIGSNILEFQIATPVFWFAAGVIASLAAPAIPRVQDPDRDNEDSSRREGDVRL